MTADERALFTRVGTAAQTDADLLAAATFEADRALRSLPPHCLPTTGGLPHNEDHANACAHRCWSFLRELGARAGDLTRLREWVAEVRYVDPSLAARIDAKLMVTERCSECRYVGLLDGHLPPSNTCPNTGKVAKRERV